MKTLYRFFIILVLTNLPCLVYAQQWQSKGILHEDKTVRVEIEFNLGAGPCVAGGALSRFRYHVYHLGGRPDFYIGWRFDYFNCDNELRSQFNALHVTAATKELVFKDGNGFAAKQMVNFLSYSNVSKKFPQDDPGFQLTSNKSMEPAAINGRNQINAGETTLLTLKGGYLSSGSNWQWYENDCQGIPVGKGASLSVRPTQTTTYYVRAEGKNNTPCVAFELKVAGATNLGPAGVDGPRQACVGYPITLRVTGGELSPGMRWVWYREDFSSAVGEGNTLQIVPDRTTTYYVRGEGAGGSTGAKAWRVELVTAPPAPVSVTGPVEAPARSYQIFTVRADQPSTGTNWVWYQVVNGQYYRLASGAEVSIQLPSESTTLAVRAESTCGNSNYMEWPVKITGAPVIAPTRTSDAPKFYLNGGVVAQSPDQVKNLTTYVVTIGGGNRLGWYVRYKFSTGNQTPQYTTTTGQIFNYNSSGYYQYTGLQWSKRTGYTGGIYLGSPQIGIYLGGGYGQYQSIYEIGQYQYGGGYFGNAYVEDLSSGHKGAELEGGLLIRLGFFNLMGGIATVQGKYTDYHAGIGFNF